MQTLDVSWRPSASILDWLLESDPAIRWQVMRDLADAPADAIAAERARVATEGWGAQLLAQQRADGNWNEALAAPQWRANLFTPLMLRAFGLDPASAPARSAVARMREAVTWGHYFDDSPYFDGEVEPCINGHVLAVGAYFGESRERLLERLLGEQLADGGWNCEAERGSVRSSFHTTVCVLEGLLAYERANGTIAAVTDARTRAHDYLLERHLLRRLSTGAVIDETWMRPAFPTMWHYDVLRALDYLRSAGVEPDTRVDEAIASIVSRRGTDGRWPLDRVHADALRFDMEGGVGAPSRWITLRALRVLRWYAERYAEPSRSGAGDT